MNDLPDTTTARLTRNITLYPWYAATFNGFAWMPVFFLYFSEHMSLITVLRLEAIYYASVVLMEVPSGYFSDRVGRRPTLVISAMAFCVSYVLFLIGDGFALFATAQVLLAIGIAFNSGTDTSFLYDSLAASDREDEYAQCEAIAGRNGLFANSIAAMLGGVLAMMHLRLAYAVSLVASLASLVLVLLFIEPTVHEKRVVIGVGFFDQLRRCVGLLRQRTLAWLFAFAVLMTILNHVPYEFYQPYLSLLNADSHVPEASTPMTAAIHMAIAMLLGSWASAKSIRVRERFGIGPTLLAATMIQVLIIGLMGFVLHYVVAALALLRSVPRALMTPPLNAAITPRVPKAQRATYLSIQSLAGRLGFSATLVMLSSLVAAEDIADWTSLSRVLQTSLLIGVIGFAVLAATHRFCRTVDDKE